MPRTIWSGSLGFGLVNIPVKLYVAIRDRDVHFHLMSKDGTCRLRRKLYCPETGEEYDFQNTAKGFEVSADNYVIVHDEELKRIKPESARVIEIQDFVALSEIDPIYYDRAYYVAPDEGGVKAYRLLYEAIARAKKVGIARFVMRAKEYLVALRPTNGILYLETMHFADEIVPIEEAIGPVPQASVDKRELEAAEKLVNALVSKFDPEKYKDEYRERLEEFLERKAAGELVTLPAEERERPGRVINLMDALKKSLAQMDRPKHERLPGGRSEKPRARARKKSA